MLKALPKNVIAKWKNLFRTGTHARRRRLPRHTHAHAHGPAGGGGARVWHRFVPFSTSQ
jgi:hypothetical protein